MQVARVIRNLDHITYGGLLASKPESCRCEQNLEIAVNKLVNGSSLPVPVHDVAKVFESSRLLYAPD
jgi:hypothetical protein